MRRRRYLPVITLTVLALTLGVLAWLREGVARAEVDLNDGGIWVTNGNMRMLGHLNYPSRSLDSGLRTKTAEFDVSQHAETVLYEDVAANTLTEVDVAHVRLGSTATLGENILAFQGGERLGVLDTAEGNLWVTPANQASSADIKKTKPLHTGLKDGVLTGSADGAVFAISAASKTMVSVVPSGYTDELSSVDIPKLSPNAQLQLSAVGNSPVALDTISSQLVLPDGSLKQLPGKNLVLQAPGSESPHVLVSSSDSLYLVPLDGSETKILPATGTAAAVSGIAVAPVQLGQCAYAAWTGSGRYLRSCTDSSQDQAQMVETLAKAGHTVFRVNRKLIVLNDTVSGTVWLPNENMILVDNWEEIDSQTNEPDQEDDSAVTTDLISERDRQDNNTPPEAKDDQFGVRPGRTTQLPVLMNDSDIDGDLLTARAITEPAFGKVRQLRGGAALQIEVPASATGKTSFVYEAADGRGGTDTATVNLEVRALSTNEGPQQRRKASIVVESGREVRYNVLPDWVDPDGDPIYLDGVTSPEGMEIQSRSEGTLIVRDLNSPPGKKTATVFVSDGVETTEGEIVIDIRPPGNLPPVANGDFLVARAGEEITVAPLVNDTDPNGDQLKLIGVGASPDGTTVTPDLDLGTFVFYSSIPGVYYLTYTVSDGPTTAMGIVRIDVVESSTSSIPTAEDDLVLLPAGGEALAAVLNNDSDPGGGVLVIQSLTLPEGSPLAVTLIDHHLLRVTAPGGLDDRVSFSYTVSNGFASVDAQVIVLPVQVASLQGPPEPQPDHTKVRVGDIATVNVLANDISPSGLPLTVDPQLEHTITAEEGLPFVTGDMVRFRAGDIPGKREVHYTVRDTMGNIASTTVRFDVIPLDESRNAAPRPHDLTAWAVAGQKVRIPVPLDGIDPDGDSVILVGMDQPPEMGTIHTGVTWLEYTPSSKASGTDAFSYLVEDRLGKQASARIRIGVVPPSALNQAPTTVPDLVLVRPGRQLAVPVLANDIDPDGDPLSLLPDQLKTNSDLVSPVARGNRIVLKSPETPGTYIISYGVTDGRGGQAIGILTVMVDPEAPLQSPIARDDIVSREQLAAQGGDNILVDVLANDEDPDGDANMLQLSSNEIGVKVTEHKLAISTESKRRLVVYTVQDQDGLTGTAVVSVPGAKDESPTLNPAKIPAEVKAGGELVIDLAEYVITRPGRSAIITDTSKVKAAYGTKGAAEVRDPSTLIFRAETDYSGLTSLSFEVTDGASADDRTALRALLSLPIRVISAQNRPPTLRPTLLSVAAGEAPVEVDLSQMVNDPDGADPKEMLYAMGSPPPGLTTQLTGHILSVQARADTPTGSAGTLEITVDDGSGPVAAQLPISVVSSTRPLIQVSAVLITKARSGVAENVDLTDYIVNPFPDDPVRVIGSPSVLTGEGTVDTQGLTVMVTPGGEYLGEMVVSYLLADATGDPTRQVEGQIRLVVRDRPSPPTAVSAESNGPGVATVKWTSGAANGAPITGFVVTDSVSGNSFPCASTICSLSDLDNGSMHSFTVIAQNEVGDSDPSESSQPILIDIIPSSPTNLQVSPGDGSLQVTWDPAVTEGSAISGYKVTLSSELGTQEFAPISATNSSYDDLVNGVTYQISIVAINAEGDSAPAIAAGIPVGNIDKIGFTLTPAGPGAVTINVTNTDYLGWNPPPSYQYKIGTGDWQALTGTNQTVSGLGCGSRPNGVRAVWSGGNKVFADQSVALEPVVPQKPQISLESQEQMISYKWESAALAEGCSLGNITLKVAGSDQDQIPPDLWSYNLYPIDATGQDYLNTTLTPDEDYIWMSAQLCLADGVTCSEIATATIKHPPPPPPPSPDPSPPGTPPHP